LHFTRDVLGFAFDLVLVHLRLLCRG
jgi:hypothetical protein